MLFKTPRKWPKILKLRLGYEMNVTRSAFKVFCNVIPVLRAKLFNELPEFIVLRRPPVASVAANTAASATATATAATTTATSWSHHSENPTLKTLRRKERLKGSLLLKKKRLWNGIWELHWEIWKNTNKTALFHLFWFFKASFVLYYKNIEQIPL